jgi:carbohydrate kinase (thermoresistant glucokinase family)
VILIVSGVAGSGKTTVGVMLAQALHWHFEDADTFHSEANVAKMHAGIPLTDEDRAPWLRALADWMDAQIAAGRSCVLACSCLKRAYRDLLLSGRPAAQMVFLHVDRDILERRLAARQGHFFPQKLLASQLHSLEPPIPEERVYTVRPESGALQTSAKILTLLWPHGIPEPEGPA